MSSAGFLAKAVRQIVNHCSRYSEKTIPVNRYRLSSKLNLLHTSRRCYCGKRKAPFSENVDEDTKFGDIAESDLIDDDVESSSETSTVYSAGTHGASELVFVVQPKIAWGPYKARTTTPELMLSESIALAETIPNWKVTKSTIVNVKFDVDSPTVFGSGNVAKLTAQIFGDANATRVFINVDVLSPTQQSLLYKEWNVPVFDRFQIVLSIFKAYAKSKSAKLHVAIAELPYLAARIRELTIGSIPDTMGALGTMGGIGFKLLEERSNMFKKRESRLKAALEKVRQERSTTHEKLKKEAPLIAVVGYTNAGKTSLVNCLTKSVRVKEQQDLLPQDRLFATLDATVHRGRLPSSNLSVFFADTVGFIADIPIPLVASFEATLDCIRYASLIVHIRDVSHPNSQLQKETVDKTLKNLNLPERLITNLLEVCNKIDKAENIATLEPESPTRFHVSCMTGQGMDRLQNEIDKLVRILDDYITVTLNVPNGGEEMKFLEEKGGINGYEEMDGGNRLLITTTVQTLVLKMFLKRYGNLIYKKSRMIEESSRKIG